MNNQNERQTIIKLLKNVISELEENLLNVKGYADKYHTTLINNEIDRQTAALNWVQKGLR
jgi:septation ring formation regulator EzrA